MDACAYPPETVQDRQLQRLAALGLELAENLQARALAAQTGAEAAQLTGAYHKVTRGLRQTIALQLRLKRDEQAFARERMTYARDFAPLVDRQQKEAVARRRTDLYIHLERTVWDEFESDPEAFKEICEGLRARLDEEAELSTFLDEPFPLQLARLKDWLGCGPASPDAAASAGGGPPAERSEERVVEGESPTHSLSTPDDPAAPQAPDSS